jgi:hypothetical protein
VMASLLMVGSPLPVGVVEGPASLSGRGLCGRPLSLSHALCA